MNNNVDLIKKLFPNNEWSIEAIHIAWLFYLHTHEVAIGLFGKDFENSLGNIMEAVELLTLMPGHAKSEGKKQAEILVKEWIEKSELIEEVKNIVEHKIMLHTKHSTKEEHQLLYRDEFYRKSLSYAVAQIVDDTTPTNQTEMLELWNVLIKPFHDKIKSEFIIKKLRNKESSSSRTEVKKQQADEFRSRWIALVRPNAN